MAQGRALIRHGGRLLLGAALASALAAAGAQPALPAGCEAAALRAPPSAARASLLGSTTLPRVEGSAARSLGGISGIDFDPGNGTWWLISDDKGEHAVPGAYPARIDIGARGLGAVQVQEPVALPLFPAERADAEALRRHPCGALWAWASEGDAASGQPPSVRWLQWPAPGAGGLTARPMGALDLPPALRPRPAAEGRAATGPRPNRSFEGLAFTPAGDALWIALEGPLLEDGPEPDAEHGAGVRFTRLPLAGGPAAQYVYPLDPIRHPATGGRLRADNGVSEIVALAGGELLVIERNGYEVADNRFAFAARLYVADAGPASDVSARPSLVGADIVPMRKRLLLDLSALGLPQLDNLEAAAWGPRLADGRAMLVLMSDDNFAPGQVTQLIVLAVEAAP